MLVEDRAERGDGQADRRQDAAEQPRDQRRPQDVHEQAVPDAVRLVDRLTPFTGGAAIAVLIVACVVQPAKAVTPACAACMDYWTANSNKAGQPCYGMTGQYLQLCISQQIQKNCAKKVECATYTTPCFGDPGNPGYTDCTSENCSYVSCWEYNGTICTNFCNNCDANGTKCNQLQQVNKSKFSPCLSYCGCGNP